MASYRHNMTKNDTKTDTNKETAWLVYAKQDLKPYQTKRTMHIFTELKYQRPFADQVQTVSFFDLPGELRNEVYRYHLVLDRPMELWAKTNEREHDWPVRWRDIAFWRKLIRSRKLNLGLFRVCKQLNLEAAPIFYGENEFRFSGINGHIVAHSMFFTIRQRNFQWLKSITIAMPFFSNNEGCFASNWNAVTPRRIEDVLHASPYRSQRLETRRRYNSYDVSFYRLVRYMKQATSLETMNLVLPDSFAIITYQLNIWTVFQELVLAKPFLDVVIVRMQHPDSNRLYERDRQRRLIKKLKAMCGICHVKQALYAKNGQWTLESDVVDDDLTDILPDIGRLFQ
ncbi:hypothetical protein EJ04DRAFT_556187 [Polyplosphaeria fusca]|uniref:F-box domain-containing protein n=1 Tax=Polyplosphaeria fusca TaxID=682080 RepID=A0A9P4UUV7_9PLEO|nr:hypothetical protein EJ04DRAFT_556187 [Polyplosphaeria fusca]